MRWYFPWASVATSTSTGTGESPGTCCRCREYGMVLLGGHTFYCWEHYCAEMAAVRDCGDGQSQPD